MWNWLLRLADEARHSARSRRASVEQVVGRRGEDLAHRFLEKRGLRIVARNYRPPSGGGEIDLIGWDGETLVLVEVKCRTSDEAGAPERNVDADKVRQMQRAGRDFARRAGVPWERVRLDLVSVVLDDPPVIRHQRDAFPVKAL